MINLGRVENLGLRKINTHIPNQFELSRREIQGVIRLTYQPTGPRYDVHCERDN
jgi:hypothetical protein